MKRLLIALTLLLPFVVMPTAKADSTTIIACNFTDQRENVDPIVSPGEPSSHTHIFYGAVGVTPNTIGSNAFRELPTTCFTPGDRSGYWIPELREDGQIVPPTTRFHMLAYLRCNSDCRTATGFPEDFTAVMGNANASSVAENPVFDNGLGGFRCGTGGGTIHPHPPTTCDSGILVIRITFERVNGIRLQLFFRFRIGSGPVGEITLGGQPSHTLHGDFAFGWTQSAWQALLEQCVQVNRDCGKNPALT